MQISPYLLYLRYLTTIIRFVYLSDPSMSHVDIVSLFVVHYYVHCPIALITENNNHLAIYIKKIRESSVISYQLQLS